MFPADKQNKTQNHEPSYLLKKKKLLPWGVVFRKYRYEYTILYIKEL